MLTNRNSKLGKSIWAFNLPAGVTCPGASEACSAMCYAKKTERIYSNARLAYAANLEQVQGSKDWTDDVIGQIKAKRIATVRIHAKGDFYSAEYILEWIDIAAACPDTIFFAYTRSWRVAGLLPALEALKALKNVRLLASVDWTTGPAPDGWRAARMMDKAESKAIKAGARPAVAGIVCLEQAGKAESCGDCKVCFKPGKGTVNFILH